MKNIIIALVVILVIVGCTEKEDVVVPESVKSEWAKKVHEEKNIAEFEKICKEIYGDGWGEHHFLTIKQEDSRNITVRWKGTVVERVGIMGICPNEREHYVEVVLDTANGWYIDYRVVE